MEAEEEACASHYSHKSLDSSDVATEGVATHETDRDDGIERVGDEESS